MALWTWSRQNIFLSHHKKKKLKENYEFNYIKAKNLILSESTINSMQIYGSGWEKGVYHRYTETDIYNNSQNTNICHIWKI